MYLSATSDSLSVDHLDGYISFGPFVFRSPYHTKTALPNHLLENKSVEKGDSRILWSSWHFQGALQTYFMFQSRLATTNPPLSSFKAFCFF